MKFIHYLEKITGVGIFPLTSLMIFFLFFTALLVWVFKADKYYMRLMKDLPLTNDEQD
jgi:cytochrome c oxidase cbb3-type subunit IV